MAPFYINGTTGISGVDGSAATPALQGSDTNTGISFGSDVIIGSTGGLERWRTDASGRFLVGTSSWSVGATAAFVGNSGGSTGNADVHLSRGLAATGLSSGQDISVISFSDNAGGKFAQIGAQVDGTPGTNDYPGRLVFSTTADGASSPTERMRLDSAGSMVLASGTAFVAPYIYNATTATATNVNVDASGFLRRSTSSIKYKTNIETVEDQYSDALLQCRPVWYQSTCEADKPEWGHWGFIAEEVAQIDPRLCFFKEEEDGTLEPEGVQYDRFVPHLLNLIKRQNERIEALEATVAALSTTEVTP